MIGTEGLDAVEVAYEVAQDAGFAYHVAQGARRPDADALHAVYAAAWAAYLEQLTAAVRQVPEQQVSGEGTR